MMEKKYMQFNILHIENYFQVVGMLFCFSGIIWTFKYDGTDEEVGKTIITREAIVLLNESKYQRDYFLYNREVPAFSTRGTLEKFIILHLLYLNCSLDFVLVSQGSLGCFSFFFLFFLWSVSYVVFYNLYIYCYFIV